MSTGARCSRCCGCSCSRSSYIATGDSKNHNSSLFYNCTRPLATATPATAATPLRGSSKGQPNHREARRTQTATGPQRLGCGHYSGHALVASKVESFASTHASSRSKFAGHTSLYSASKVIMQSCIDSRCEPPYSSAQRFEKLVS